MHKTVFCKLCAVTVCITLIFLVSCAAKKYTDTIECSTITDAIRAEILTDDDYLSYTPEDISFMINDIEGATSYSVIYSRSGDDIGEIGVFHAASDAQSFELLDEVTEYLHDLKEEKRAFVKSYLPTEEKKLNDASVKRFGNYVVFTVLDRSYSDAVFEKIEKLLK